MEWIDKAPKVNLYRETKRQVRWLAPGQAQTLFDELQEHQRDMVLFALAIGLRQGNVTGLCWSQIDLERRTAWIAGEDVKNGDDLHVSLNDLALAATAPVGQPPGACLHLSTEAHQVSQYPRLA